MRLFGVVLALMLGVAVLAADDQMPNHVLLEWRGLTVAPEDRCSPYERDDYPYSPSVEKRIVATMGDRIYGPYTGRIFSSTRQTDIEHIVAVSEGHDSGLCAADAATRKRFSSDLLNLTLAAPRVNRCSKSGKCAKDAAEWLPQMNQCWFANRIVEVRRQYGLTVDRREADALELVLSACSSTKMIFHDAGVTPEAVTPPVSRDVPTSGNVDALGLWDDNDNGRITCSSEVRHHGIAPVLRGHPAYSFMDDRNGDGVVCE